MSKLPEMPLGNRSLWIAVEFSDNKRLNVFGPYFGDQAQAIRTMWLAFYPTFVRVSAIFSAKSREEAEVKSHLYMPKKR